MTQTRARHFHCVPRAGLLLAALALLGLACARATLPPSTGGGETGGLPIEENFGSADAHSWDIFTDDPDMTAQRDAGRLLLGVNVPDEFTWSILQDESAVLSDVLYEADATALAGPSDNSYGLIFRYGDRYNFYSFDISSDGYYTLRARQGSGEKDTQTRKLIDWTGSPAIHAGLQQTNRLRVVAQGSEITLMVNGETVNHFSDATFTRGRVGVSAGAFQEPGVKVAFDNIVINKP